LTELRRKPEVDYYKVLQVDSEAESEVIEAAYRALSKKYHPDVNRAADSMDRMSLINSAYDVLSDPSKRRSYNYLRNGGNRNHTAPAPSPSPASPSPSPVSPTGSYWSPGANQKTGNNSNSNPGFSPSSAQAPGPKPGATSSFRQTNVNQQTGSFRPQDAYPSNTNPPKEPPRSSRVAESKRPAPNYEERPRSRFGLWLLLLLLLLVLVVGGVLAQESFLGNPLKTSFINPAQGNSNQLVGTTRPTTLSTTPSSTPLPAGPTSRDQILAFLNNSDFYAGRILDLNLTTSDVLQLRVKLAANGGVLNSEKPASSNSDDLDILRQSEATSYNLVYTMFGRFLDLNRINLVLLDTKDKPVYRADVVRSEAYTFYSWHTSVNSADAGSVIKVAQQDRLMSRFGVSLDDATRIRLNAPTAANLQAELTAMGLTAFTVTGDTQFSVNYFQERNQAEMVVDFTRIIYTLYTRFPTLDRLQITVSNIPDKPVKVLDRQLFSQVYLELWAQASYGGVSAGGDRQAASLITALPSNFSDLRSVAATIQAKFKTPAQVGAWYVVTEAVERYDNLVLEGLRFSAAKDRQFLVVRVALRNTSDTRQWLLPGERMSLLDTRNQTTYVADPIATMLYLLKTPPSSDPPPGPIEANKQGAVYAVFSVPTNTNLATLRLQFQDGDKKAIFELS
jgi:curved DNA-binding protein CbpA